MGSSVTIPENEGERKPGIVYKTSIYGWGKLKYPVRKNGKILVYVEAPTNKSNVGLMTSNRQPGSDKNGHKPIPSSSSRIIPKPATTTSPQTRKPGYLLHQGDRPWDKVSPKPKSLAIPNTTTSTRISNPSDAPSRFPNTGRTEVTNVNTRIKQIDASTKLTPTSLTFYGQYRCSKCSKYWRSPHSKEGISQNCSKCGTPTLPKK